MRVREERGRLERERGRERTKVAGEGGRGGIRGPLAVADVAVVELVEAKGVVAARELVEAALVLVNRCAPL